MAGITVPISVIVTLEPGADSKSIRQAMQNAIRSAVVPLPGVQAVNISPVVT